MARNTQSSRARSQRGGTFLGLVLGLIVGLAIAVVVAVYITKAPVPFVSRRERKRGRQDAQRRGF